MSWLTQNIGSLCVLFAVVLLSALLVRSLVLARKSGKSHCAGCLGCAFSGKCRGECGADFSKTDK